MKARSYFYCGLTTTLNIILYALTFGNFLWLEGRVCHGYFRNWLRRFGYRPHRFELLGHLRTMLAISFAYYDFLPDSQFDPLHSGNGSGYKQACSKLQELLTA